jgi:hypothetical protein
MYENTIFLLTRRVPLVEQKLFTLPGAPDFTSCFLYIVILPQLSFLSLIIMLEDTRGVIRIRKWKDRQHSDQIKKAQKDKQRSTKHTAKTKDRVTRTPQKTGGEIRGVSTMAFGLFILKHTKLNLIYLNKFKKDINCNSNCNSNIIFFGEFSTKTSFL